MRGFGTITSLGTILILLLMNAVHLSKKLQFIVGIVTPAVLAAFGALFFEHTPTQLLLISAAFGNIAFFIGIFWILRLLNKKSKWPGITLGVLFFLTMLKVGGLDLFTVTITALLVISEEVAITPPFFPKVFIADRYEDLAARKAFLITSLFIRYSSQWQQLLRSISMRPSGSQLFFKFPRGLVRSSFSQAYMQSARC
jgi:hypothetical protein